MDKLLFLKVETNGLPFTRSKLNDNNLDDFPNVISIYYKICEINSNNKLNILLSNYNVIKPTFEINKNAQKIHELTNSKLLKGNNITNVLNQLNTDINKYNIKKIIGHNINFDLNFVMAEIKRNNINLNLFNLKPIDIMYYNHEYEYPKLEKLYELLYKKKFIKSHKRKSLINIIIKCYEYLHQLQ